MASHNIEFNLGSKFQGEGWQKASEAIKQNQKELNSARQGLGELKTAFSEISPATAEAVSGVSKFVQAFTTGGIVGGLIATAMTALGEAVKFVGEKLQEAKERAEAYAEAMKTNVLNAISDAGDKFNALKGDIGEVNSELQDTLNLANSDVTFQAQSKINEIRNNLAQSLQGLDENAAKVATAMADAEIAQIKHNAEVEKATNAVKACVDMNQNAKQVVEAAEERRKTAVEKVAELEEQFQPYLDKRKQITDYLATQEERLKEKEIGVQEVIEARIKTTAALTKLDEENKEAVAALKQANDAAKTATEDLATAKKNALIAEDKLTEATQKSTLAEQEAATSKTEMTNKVKAACEQQEVAIAEATRANNDWAAFLDQQRAKLENMKVGGVDLQTYNDAHGIDYKKLAAAIAEAQTSANAEANADMEPVVNAVNNAAGNVNAAMGNLANNFNNQQIVPFRQFLNNERQEARAMRDRVSEWRQKVGTEYANFFQAIVTPERLRTGLQTELINYFTSQLIPTMRQDIGDEMTAKLLSSESRRILMPSDLREFWGDQGSVITLIREMGVK